MSHISFSAFKIWNECPHKHKLVYIDRLQGFEGNEYTAFGTALHSVCENKLLNESLNEKEHFQQTFLEELSGLPENVRTNLNKQLVQDMRKQGNILSVLAIPAENMRTRNLILKDLSTLLLKLPMANIISSIGRPALGAGTVRKGLILWSPIS
jgi:hypothetical protein